MIFPPAADNPLRTKSDLLRLLRDLTTPLMAHRLPGGAGLRLGATQAWYGEPGALLEAFSRPLWGWMSAALGGCGEEFPWELWKEGLLNGTDPRHREYWGIDEQAGSRCDQRCVEMPALALALMAARGRMWEPLSEVERDRVAAWLSRIFTSHLPENNWLFFRVLTHYALRRLGREGDPAVVKADLARLEDFYLGDGWYADGVGRVGDYYVPMAMHFYGLLGSALFDDEDPGRFAAYRQRAQIFAGDFQHYFAAGGEAIPFGRSLTYRFAQGAFWSALALAGVEALPWGRIKGLLLRHLRWWVRQPIFTESGLLTIGYAYPNLMMAEDYNAPGSPYWAFKAFLPLALHEEHPFWTANEEEAPPELEGSLALPHASMVVSSRPRKTDVIALNAGQRCNGWPRHAAQKYSKLAYSARRSFAVSAGDSTLARGGFDACLAFSVDGLDWRTRSESLAARVDRGIAWSRWSAGSGVEVETWLVALDGAEARIHFVTTPLAVESAECGFATACLPRDPVQDCGPGRALCIGPAGWSGLLDLGGRREGSVQPLEANSHLRFPLSAMPVLRSRLPPGRHWLACLQCSGEEGDAATMTSSLSFSADKTGWVLAPNPGEPAAFLGRIGG